MNAPKKLALLVISLFGLTLAQLNVARADLPPPETEPCVNKAVGAACNFSGMSGTCQDGACSRTDQRTGQTSTFSCRKCVTGPDRAEEESGCAMAPGPRAFGPWILAGGFALLVLGFRRRRR